jgi:hypothetical protein
MNCVWKATLPPPSLMGRISDCVLYYYRRCFLRRLILIITKRYVLPVLWAAFMLYFGTALISHVAFNVWDASGFFCNAHSQTKSLVPDEKVEILFPSNWSGRSL